MTNFYTSDWHIHHKKIKEYCPYSRKGTSAEEMTSMILDNIHSQVKPGDAIYNIGDVSFGTFEQTKDFLTCIKKMRVHHHLILGNHDARIKNSAELCSLFSSVQDKKIISVDKQSIVFSHFPESVWERGHYGAWHLHGHSHGSFQTNGKILDVGIDTRHSGDMKMYSHDEVKKIMDFQMVIKHH